MNFGPRIKQARVGAKLTQDELASRVGVSQGAVYQWEKDKTSPSTSNLADVALVTGVSFDWLATGREPGDMSRVEETRDMEYRVRLALPGDERQLLEIYRELDEPRKVALLEFLKKFK